GDGKQYRSLGDVPWGRLRAGDTVRVYWREAPYREKILLSGRGMEGRPIRIVGVPGPGGRLPVIDGRDATTSSQFDYPYAPTQDRGVVIVTRGRGQGWGYKPGHLVIEGLEIRGAYKGDGGSSNTFRDARGQTRSYSRNAAAVYVERGEHITVRGCTITDSANGLFVASSGSEEVQSRDILVEGNYIHGNGNPGRDQEHNV